MASILIIDDENMVRMVLRQTLEKAGHTVTEAFDGAKGLAAMKDQKFDLVITDIVMPEKEGIETIIQVRLDNPKLPIIAISGGGRIGPTDYLKAASELGANHVFPKPFDRQKLLATVESCLTNVA